MEVREVTRSLALSETRRVGRQRHGRWVELASGVAFIVLLLQLELSLFFVRTNASFSLQVVPWTGQLIWWNFPILQVLSPWAVLILPVFPGIAAGLTAILAGLGMGAAYVGFQTLGKRSSGALERPIAGAVALLGISCFVLPLAMEAGAYWAYFNDPQGYTWWVYAWYLYPLQVGADYGMLMVLERVLRVTKGLRLSPPVPEAGDPG